MELKGRTQAWGTPAIGVLAILFIGGLFLRLTDLAAEGFSDDEVHKWLAINRYLNWDFVGDDIEHPMLMKWLMTAALLIGRELQWAPETIVRLPNVFVGAGSIIVTAFLGRRIFGRVAGVAGAAIVAFSPTMIGYQRVAKEDTLLGFFLMLALLFLAEAKAAADDEPARDRDRVRYEWLTAAAIGLMIASKYFFHFAFIPVLAYAWMRRGDTKLHLPAKRWGQLIAGAFLLFAAVNWTPFLPSSWAYGLTYMSEQPALKDQTVHGSLFFMGEIHHNLPSYGLRGTPPWFYLVFAAVKLAPLTIILATIGFIFAVKERKPGHVIILSWMVLWFGVFSISGAKWGRFFQTILPAFALLAGHAVTRALAWLESARPRLAPAFATAMLLALGATEASAALQHAPRYRLYVSVLGGGPENIQWFFPHCDYYDSGFREAMKYVAGHAEPGAELSTEIDWVARYYAETYGRKDLVHTLPRRGVACKDAEVCYVVVQSGRWYHKNQEAIEYLSSKEPVFVEHFGGKDVVKVYRLQRGDRPYAEDRVASAKAN